MTQPRWFSERIQCGKDQASGAEIIQITSNAVISTNIYCEQRYASADGRRIAIQRTPFSGPSEIWVCDLPTMRLVRAAEGIPLAGNALRNVVYYYAVIAGSGRLMRLDLVDLSIKELFQFKSGAQTGGFLSPEAPKGTISPDERWFVGGPFRINETRFSLRIVELASGEERNLCEQEDMFNPHMQFDPGNSGRLLIQVNRGVKLDQEGNVEQSSGPDGSTLKIVEVPSGKVSPLPAGKPDTAQISGHQCWAGQTGLVVFTAAPGVHESMVPGTGVYAAVPGEKAARKVALGQPFNHLAVSDDGKYFIVDDYRTMRVHVGSLASGRFLELCDTRTRQGKPQYTHTHPYMTPDNKHVIFNSNVTGISQVYAAKIPDGFLDTIIK